MMLRTARKKVSPPTWQETRAEEGEKRGRRRANLCSSATGVIKFRHHRKGGRAIGKIRAEGDTDVGATSRFGPAT
jgi:hypothetical protein